MLAALITLDIARDCERDHVLSNLKLEFTVVTNSLTINSMRALKIASFVSLTSGFKVVNFSGIKR